MARRAGVHGWGVHVRSVHPPAAAGPLPAARARPRPLRCALTCILSPLSVQSKASKASKPKPLSPGSNYPTTSNIQTQKSGFGNFLQKFQKVRASSRFSPPRRTSTICRQGSNA